MEIRSYITRHSLKEELIIYFVESESGELEKSKIQLCNILCCYVYKYITNKILKLSFGELGVCPFTSMH